MSINSQCCTLSKVKCYHRKCNSICFVFVSSVSSVRGMINQQFISNPIETEQSRIIFSKLNSFLLYDIVAYNGKELNWSSIILHHTGPNPHHVKVKLSWQWNFEVVQQLARLSEVMWFNRTLSRMVLMLCILLRTELLTFSAENLAEPLTG